MKTRMKNEENYASNLKIKPFKLVNVLIVMLILAGTVPANAQFTQGFQLKSGLATQSDLFDIYSNSDLKFAYGLGWTGEYQFNKGFALQSGLEFLEKGKTYEVDEISTTNRFQYMEVPLLGKFIFGENAGLKNGKQFYVAAGPYVSYLLSAKNSANSQSVTITDSANKLDAGLRFGMGFEFPAFRSNTLQLGIDYDMGMNDVYQSGDSSKNKMATINVGLLF